MEAKLSINATPNQKNAAFIRELWETTWYNLVIYSIQTHYDSIPTKRWDTGTLTHLSLFYTIFREKLKKITVIEINYSQGQWNTEQTAQTYV